VSRRLGLWRVWGREKLTTRTGDELKKYYCDVLGNEFGKFLYEVYSQTVWLFVEWEQYKKLFTDEKTVDILNKTAKSYFALQQRIQWNSVALNISKLIDNEKVGKYNNLTYFRMPSYIVDENLRCEIKAELEKLKKERESIKILRDNLLAHNGFECILNEDSKADVIHAVTRLKIEILLNLIERIFQKVYKYYFHAHISFEKILFPFNASHLIYALKSGIRHEKLRRENPNFDPNFWQEN
jgi:hypothetical protein